MKRLDKIKLKISMSGLSLIMFILALYISSDGELIIFHPVLCIIGIFISSVAYIMYLFAFKKEEKRKPTGNPDLNKLSKNLETRLKDVESKQNLTDREKDYLVLEIQKMIVSVNDLYLKSIK